MKRRLQIARALINEPRLVLLDEPTTGLDPQARHLVWERLRELSRRGAALILTTHYMEEAAQLCDRLVIMDHGRIVRSGAPVGPRGRGGRARGAGAAGRAGRRRGAARAPSTAACAPTSATATCSSSTRTTPRPCTTRRGASGTPLHLQVARPATLEDVFLRLTGRSLREGEPPREEQAEGLPSEVVWCG